MSLKTFHVLFVTASVVLGIGFAVWCFVESSRAGGAGYLVAGVVSIACCIGLSIYGNRFVRKLKDIGW